MPPPCGWGVFFAPLCFDRNKGYTNIPPSLSLLFLPTVKDYPQISYPLRFIHAAA